MNRVSFRLRKEGLPDVEVSFPAVSKSEGKRIIGSIMHKSWSVIDSNISEGVNTDGKRIDWLDRHCSFVADGEYKIGPYKIGELRQMADAGISADAAK